MLEIMFVNKLTKNYASMHSMGLAYNKHNEGGDYPGRLGSQNDTIPSTAAVPPVDAGIAPGNCVVYKWLADDGSGPSIGPASVRQLTMIGTAQVELTSYRLTHIILMWT